MKTRAFAFLLAVALLAPAVAWGLPRPPGASQTGETEAQVGLKIDLDAQDGVGKDTPELVKGRAYRFEFAGTWKPSGAVNHFADAGFETTDGWTTWDKTGKGVVINSTNYGDRLNPELDQPDTDTHTYSITWIGRGVEETVRIHDTTSRGDNQGFLTLKIFQVSKVVYELPVVGEANQDVPVQHLATVRWYRNGVFLCIGIRATDGTETPIGCVNDLGQVQDGSVPLGGGSILAGAKVVVTFAWTGDRSKLYSPPLEEFIGTNRMVFPFHSSDIPWFQANYETLSARISVAVEHSGQVLFSDKVAEIPGLGQMLEAMFETNVAGV